MSSFKSIIQYPLLMGVLLFIGNTSNAQSGWTKKKGEYYFKLYSTFGSSSDYYSLSGNKISTAKFSQLTTGVYGEYGLSDRLTLTSHGPALKHHYFETTEKITGIADWSVGVKYGLLTGNIPVSFELLVDVPIAKANNFAQRKGSTFETINLPTGDGEWNYKFTLAGSHSFYPIPIYVSVFLNYNYRTSYNDVSYSNQFIAGGEIGAKILNTFWIIAAISTQSSLGSSQVVDFVRGEGTEFTAVQLNGIYQISNRTSLNLGVFGYNDFLRSRANLYSGTVVSVGIAYELSK